MRKPKVKKGTSRKSKNGREFNRKKQLLDREKTFNNKEKQKAIDNTNKNLDDAQKATELNLDPNIVQEKYAADLVMMSMLTGMIKSMSDDEALKDAKDDLENQLKEIAQGKADESIRHNLETYNEFKDACKYAQIVEIKKDDPNLSEKEKEKLAIDLREAESEINYIARKFEIPNAQDESKPLKFKNAEEFMGHIEKVEGAWFANDYRTKIADIDKISIINETPLGRLKELVDDGKIRENDVSYSQALESVNKLNDDMDTALDIAKKTSPALETV